MQSHHAHLDFHPSAANEPKVHSDAHVKSVATAAMKDIPGATELINNHFEKGPWKIPYAFAPKKYINLPFSLGW
jgi:hypothetical protein